MNILFILVTVLLSTFAHAQDSTALVKVAVQCPECSYEQPIVVFLLDAGNDLRYDVLNSEGEVTDWPEINYGHYTLLAKQGEHKATLEFDCEGGDQILYFVSVSEDGQVSIQESSRRRSRDGGNTRVEVTRDPKSKRKIVWPKFDLQGYYGLGFIQNAGAGLGAGLGDQLGQGSTMGYRLGGQLLVGLCDDNINSADPCLQVKVRVFDAFGRFPRQGYLDLSFSPALGLYIDEVHGLVTIGYEYNAMGVKPDGGYWYLTHGVPVNLSLRVWNLGSNTYPGYGLWLSAGVTPQFGLIQGQGRLRRQEFGGLYGEFVIELQRHHNT